jgi:hypothetical protein
MNADELKNELDRKACERAERRKRASTYKERVTKAKDHLLLRERDHALPRDVERLSVELGSYKRRKRG